MTAARPPYCRKKRFNKLLYNVWGARSPRMEDALVRYIEKNNPQNASDILSLIRKSKQRSFKRYDCISKLCVDLLRHRPTPLSQNHIQMCMGIFQRVELHHRVIGGCFPAYSFLLELCMYTIDRVDLLQYIHRLKCEKRRMLYFKQYAHCFHRRTEPI